MDGLDSGGFSGGKKGGGEIGGGLDGGVGEKLDFDGERLDFDGLNSGDSSGKRGGGEIRGDFDGGVSERLDFDGLNSGDLSGKRRAGETGGDFDGGVRERLDFDGLNSGDLSGTRRAGETRGEFDGGVSKRLGFDVLYSGGLSWKKRVDGIGGDLDEMVREKFDGLNLGGLSDKKKGVDEIRGGLDGGVYEKLDFDTYNSCAFSGRKRGIDEIGGSSDGGVNERLNLDGGVCGKRRVRVFDRTGGEGGAWKGVVEEGNEVVNLSSDDSEIGRDEVYDVIGLEKLGERSCSLEGEKDIIFDLNVSVSDGGEFVGRSVGVGGNDRVRDVTDRKTVEFVNISSDEEEDLVVLGDNKGKGKLIENEASFGSNSGLDLKKLSEADRVVGGSMDGGSRYTREEKGKAKDVQPCMSFDRDLMDDDFLYALDNFMNPVPAINLQEIFQPTEAGIRELEYFNRQQHNELGFQREQDNRELELRIEQNARELELRNEELARIDEELRKRETEHRKRAHRRFARPLEEDWYGESSANDPNIQLATQNIQREHKLKRSHQPLIRWEPSENRENTIAKRFVPSLLDLSLNVLASNADMILSLEGVPNTLKKRLCNLVCDFRKMNVRVLDLFIRDSPEEIRVKDASWITEDQFKKSLGSFDPKNLKVFQFDLCGQCISDDTLAATLARSSSVLPGLGIISLRGACHLSDEAVKVLVKLAPGLCSVNLGECSLLTHVGINYIADALGNCLRELFIDNCCGIDARDITLAFEKFKHLEVLSVAGIPNLCDGVITGIITACGRNIKDLDLADCEKLTDSSLKIIGQTCSDLRALSIVNLHNLTDVGLSYLGNGCQCIRSLKLGRNKFSDESIAEFIEIAGSSLEELSLNRVSQVGPFTALSLAKFSRKLSSLDLSWCRKVRDEELGLIVDSCWSLKLLKLFGCTQITNVFLHGHSNSLVKIIGLDMTSLLERVGPLRTEEMYLRYSPLPVPCGSENLDQQDV